MTTKKAMITIQDKDKMHRIEIPVDFSDTLDMFIKIHDVSKPFLKEGVKMESIFFYEEREVQTEQAIKNISNKLKPYILQCNYCKREFSSLHVNENGLCPGCSYGQLKIKEEEQ